MICYSVEAQSFTQYFPNFFGILLHFFQVLCMPIASLWICQYTMCLFTDCIYLISFALGYISRKKMPCVHRQLNWLTLLMALLHTFDVCIANVSQILFPSWFWVLLNSYMCKFFNNADFKSFPKRYTNILTKALPEVRCWKEKYMTVISFVYVYVCVCEPDFFLLGKNNQETSNR